MKKILILCENKINEYFDGPSMRAIEISRVLSKNHEVHILAPKDKDLKINSIFFADFPLFFIIKIFGIEIKIVNPNLAKEINNFDLLLTSGGLLAASRLLNRIRIPIIADLYCPWILEDLEKSRFNKKAIGNKKGLNALTKILKRCDFFICANQKQKDFYTALLLSSGKINNKLYNKDPSLKSLIDIVPTGIQSTPPIHTKNILKGIIPGIDKSNKVILWWGGIWDWLDPKTTISAFKEALKIRNDIRLVFFGAKKPDYVQDDRSIFFINNKIPYSERANLLLESDIGIVTHFDTLETQFSWRTRVLDYLWADIPIISTDGDSLSELIKINGLGKTVPPLSTEKLKDAILELLDNQDRYKTIKNNISIFRSSLYWDNVIKPIEDYINNLK